MIDALNYRRNSVKDARGEPDHTIRKELAAAWFIFIRRYLIDQQVHILVSRSADELLCR